MTIVLGKPTAHLSTICDTEYVLPVPCPTTRPFHRLPPIHLQFSSRTGAQQLPLPAPHPHLLHRPHPRPPSAPWHTTSAPLVSNLEPAWILCRRSPRLTRLPLLASPAIEALLGSLAAACFASSRSVGASIRRPRSSNRRQQRSIRRWRTSNQRQRRSNPAVPELQSAAAEVESTAAGSIRQRRCSNRRRRSPNRRRRARERASNLARAGLISFCSPSCCTASTLFVAGPYRQARYVSDGVSNICENNKKSDTPRIRIQGVSDTYPYLIRIGYAIRGFRDVSM
jgi:hypothetical protein